MISLHLYQDYTYIYKLLNTKRYEKDYFPDYLHFSNF
jgi:hypothetical protein